MTPDDVAAIRARREDWSIEEGYIRNDVDVLCDALEQAWAQRDAIPGALAYVAASATERAERAEGMRQSALDAWALCNEGRNEAEAARDEWKARHAEDTKNQRHAYEEMRDRAERAEAEWEFARRFANDMHDEALRLSAALARVRARCASVGIGYPSRALAESILADLDGGDP